LEQQLNEASMNLRLSVFDKLGPMGAFVAAMGCPACFPLLAATGSALGLGVLRPYEGWVMYVFQGLVVVSLLGNIASFLNHRKVIPLIVGLISPILIFYVFYIYFNQTLLYLGLFGLLTTAILNYLAKRRCKACTTQ
jgi:hypothetical protein